ncbi:MAG: pirin family protein [Acidobacteria bacterium]|nr:pirin family protein [Acidobacteriota bacterium]
MFIEETAMSESETRIVRARDRYHLESDWLSAYWLFSFDQYYDPTNIRFGALRVFNHDRIAGGGGFPMHPHREMEIITYVLDGTLQHRDSTGGEGLIGPGEVQRMTAGTGIVHSEINPHPTEPVRLMQMWVMPGQNGLTPSYEQRRFTKEERTGRLLPIASGAALPGVVKVHQDVTFLVSHLRPGDQIPHQLAPNRRAFVYVIEGEIALGDHLLAAGDQARIVNQYQLQLTAQVESEVILIDLA